MVENAVPSSIARPSAARRPARVSAAAAPAAMPAAAKTTPKCTPGGGMIIVRPSRATSTAGAAASAHSSAGMVQRERSDINPGHRLDARAS